MALLFITALCLCLQGWRRWLTIPCMALAVVLLYLSKSAAPLLALAASLSPLFLVAAFRLGRWAFMLTTGAGLMAVALGVLVVVGGEIDIYRKILEAVGKDSTLTGRTLLWEIGMDAFLSRPILGYGYKGYWHDPLGTGPQLVRILTDQALWFFHNNYLELAVAFGFMGPVLLATSLLAALWRAFSRLAASRQPICLWPILLILQLAVFSLAENPFVQEHSYGHILFILAVVARLSSERRQSSTSSRFRFARPTGPASLGRA